MNRAPTEDPNIWDIEARLRAGAATMQSLSKSLEELRPSPWWVASKAVAAMVFVGGIAFAAGSYPTRSEWDEVNERTEQRLQALERQLTETRAEQRATTETLRALQKGQERTEQAQQQILDRLTAPTRRRGR